MKHTKCFFADFPPLPPSFSPTALGLLCDDGNSAVVLTAYLMLGLQIAADYLEDPFGHDQTDLELDLVRFVPAEPFPLSRLVSCLCRVSTAVVSLSPLSVFILIVFARSFSPVL